MDELVQFLRARLDEDEQTARAATPGPWELTQEKADDSFGMAFSDEDSAHIVRHDPARVLRDIEAKRRIVGALESAEVALRNTEPGEATHELMTGATNSLRAAVRMLALPYADHPDYRAEWRP